MSIIIRKHHRYQNYTYHNEKRLNVSSAAAASSNCIVHFCLTLKNVYQSYPEQVSLIHDPFLSSCLYHLMYSFTIL